MKFIKNLFFSIRNGILVLLFAFNDRRTPLFAKIVVLAALIYLLLPIDILPDFIFPAGLIDDTVIVPALMYFAYRYIPQKVAEDAKIDSEN